MKIENEAADAERAVDDLGGYEAEETEDEKATQNGGCVDGASTFFIQIAADGSKWFTETAGVGRLAPNGTITEWTFAQEHPDDNIEQLGIDPSGNIYFAERNFDGAGAAGTNKVRRLNPVTNVVSTFLVPTPGGNPAGIQTNPDGTVWVSEYFGNEFALLIPSLAPHTDAFVTPNAILAGTSNGSAPRNAPVRGRQQRQMRARAYTSRSLPSPRDGLNIRSRQRERRQRTCASISMVGSGLRRIVESWVF